VDVRELPDWEGAQRRRQHFPGHPERHQPYEDEHDAVAERHGALLLKVETPEVDKQSAAASPKKYAAVRLPCATLCGQTVTASDHYVERSTADAPRFARTDRHRAGARCHSLHTVARARACP